MGKRTLLLLLLPVLTSASLAWDKAQNWLEIQSPHFLVITNASEKQGRHVADQFERMRAVFHTRFPDMQVDPAAPIVILAVKSEKDFQTLEPADYLGKGKLKLAGYFLRAADKNYILLRLDTEGEHPYETVYHEYTHLLMSKMESWLPLWLNEGLAEFYQTTEIRDKEALLGQPSDGNLSLLREKELLLLTVLFAVDHNSPYYHEENKGSIFYAESWALTHYLNVKDQLEHTHRLLDYATLISRHVDAVAAGTQAFGDLGKLQQALQNYVSQSRFTYFKMPAITQVDESAFKAQAITEPQADAVRADLMAYNRRTADARSLLDEVLKADPNNASAHETLGFLSFQEGHLDDARKWYGEAVKLDSQSYLAHYYFAAMTMRSGSLSPDEESAVERSLRTAIKLNPEFAPAYDSLGAFYAMRQRNLDDAHILSLKAIQLDPANVAYRLNAANVLMQMHRGKDAITVAQNAVSLAKNPDEQARVQDFLVRIEQYQAAQEQMEQYNRNISQGQSPAQRILADNGDTSAPPRLTRRTNSVVPPAAAGPALPAEDKVRGPHRFISGTIKKVRCSGLSAMDFAVVEGGREIPMHSENYYKIQFSALGFTPNGDLLPCTQIEGRNAKIEYIEPADKSLRNQIVVVELHP